MNDRMLASYHEAGHLVAAWLLDIPVEVVEVSNEGEGRTQLSLWYRSTSIFRDVNQGTVYRDTLFVLAGDFGERLLCPLDDEHGVSLDTYLAYVLSRRFKLDLRHLKEEVSQMIVRQRETIRTLAFLLYTCGKLDAYRLALLRMDWLARGKILSSPLATP